MINYTPVNIRSWSLLGQRGTLGKVLFDIAKENDKIFAMTADQARGLGFKRFCEEYPNRYLNMGISEQNSVGVACGLASEGFIPFVAFQAAFASFRCADQVHVAMAYMKSNIKLIGIFTGLTQGDCGPTHFGLHDIAIYRSLPNITVLSPSDATQTVKMIQEVIKDKNPVYMRIGGPNNIPVIYKKDFDYKIGEAITLKDGEDIAIIATGSMVYNSIKAAEILEQKGISTKVIDMHTIKPLDKNIIIEACSSKMIVTVEEHSTIGGLGSAVAEQLAFQKNKPLHLIIGVSGNCLHAGNYEDLLDKAGLTPEQISKKIQERYMEVNND